MNEKPSNIIDFPKAPDEVQRLEKVLLKTGTFCCLARQLMKRNVADEAINNLPEDQLEKFLKGIDQITDDLTDEMQSSFTQAKESGALLHPDINQRIATLLEELRQIVAPNLVLIRHPHHS